MVKFYRAISPLLFLMVLVVGVIEYTLPTTLVSLTVGRTQGRSSTTPSIASFVGMKHSNQADIAPQDNRSSRTSKEKFPCEFLEITASGVVCDDHRLDLPKIDLKETLDEDRHLPRRSSTVFVSEKFVDGILYRNIALELRWEPATPEFLQIYLEEYLPYWGNRIPYRLFWDAHYEVCDETCSTFSDAGEFLPEDIESLSPSLAADVNFNGVPAAFWNMNVNP